MRGDINKTMKTGSLSNKSLLNLVYLLGGGATLVAGLAVLIGWAADLPVLTSLQEGYIPMAPSTALFFSLFGLLLLSYPSWAGAKTARRLAVGLIILVTALSLLLLILSVLKIRLGIEHLGMSITGSVGGAPVGYMSPLTAGCFLLIDTALLLFLFAGRRHRRLFAAAVGAAALALLSSLVFLFSYALGGPLLYSASMIPPSLNSSVAFFVLAAATLGLLHSDNPEQGREGHLSLSDSQYKTRIPYKLLLFALFAYVSIVLTVVFSFRGYVDHFQLETERDLISIADLKVNELTQWRRERVGDAETFLGNELFSAALQRYNQDTNDSEELNALRSWLYRVKGSYEYIGVGLFDRNGNPVVEYSDADLWTQVNTYFTDDMGQERVRFIDFHRVEADGPIVLTLIVPIIGAGEPAEALGLLVFQIDPSRFLYPFIQSWPVERETVETLLVRRDGDEVLLLNELRFEKNAALELRLPLSQAEIPAAAAVSGRGEIKTGRDYRGKEVMAVVRSIPDSPWLLVAKIDTAELNAPLHSMLYGSIEFGGALLMAMIAIIAFIWQRRTKNHFRQLYQLEKLREESEEQHRITLQSIGDAVITTSTAGKITMMNKVAERLTGWRFSDASQKPVDEVFHIICEDTGERIESPIDRVLAEEKVVGLGNHTLLISKQGRRIPIADSASPIWNDSGVLYGVVLVFRDQSEEKALIGKLKASNELLASTQEVAKVGGWEIDVPSMQLSWTAETYKIHQLDPEMNIDIPTGISFFQGEARDTLHTALEKAVKDGVGYDIELPFGTAEGNQRWVRTVAQVVEKDGQIHKVKGVIQDITGRKEAERTVTRQQELLRIMEQVTKVGGWRYKLTTGLMYWTPGVYDIHEISEQEYDPNSIDGNVEFYTPEDREKISAAFRRALSEGKSYDLELRFTGAKGTEKWVRTIGIPMKDKEGAITGVYGNIMDVSDEKLTEQQLIEAQKLEALGQLAGGIAHDFNNVLMAISGASHVLEKRLRKESDQKVLAVIRSSVKRGNTVTGRMLSFTRSSKPETKPIALSSFLSEIKDIAEHTLPQHVHVYIGEVSDEQGVYADPAQLQQVLITLAINAADAMPEGGTINLYVRRPTKHEIRLHKAIEESIESYWCIEVKDEGTGMDEETKRRAFDPFFTTKGATKGTGLGLSIVYKIIQLHGGWTEIDSRPGLGTTFILGLPATEQLSKIYAVHEQHESGQGETILTIEDEMAIRTILEAALSDSGYKTLSAETGERSLDILTREAEHVDLILTDIGLPDMNGKDLILKIKELYGDIPIIAMTGYTDTDIDEALYNVGANIVMKKPYDMDELSRNIRSLL